VFDRNQAGIGEAAAELRRAEALKRQVAREGSLQVRQLTQQREALRAQLARLETWTLPTLQRLVQALSLRQVGAGGELAALLAARERLLQARLQQLELETNLTQGDLELNLLTGAEVSHE
jgi:outer membrane protein TolC